MTKKEEMYIGRTLYLATKDNRVQEIKIEDMCAEWAYIKYSKTCVVGVEYRIYPEKFKHLFNVPELAEDYILRRHHIRDLVHDILDEIKEKDLYV